jgi:hypothetical protein
MFPLVAAGSAANRGWFFIALPLLHKRGIGADQKAITDCSNTDR